MLSCRTFAIVLPSFLNDGSILGSSLLLGCGAALLALGVIRVMDLSARFDQQTWSFEVERLRMIRSGNATYRKFQPLIREIEQQSWWLRLLKTNLVRQHLLTNILPPPWRAEELVATKCFEAFLYTVVIGAAAVHFGGALGLVLAVGVFAFLVWSIERDIRKLATLRREQLDRRLSFGMDLMALMMEAGATFRESLGTLVDESRGHPLGEEFGRLTAHLQRGQTLKESLDQLQERLRLDSVNDVAFTVIKAEELGTPMSKAFLSLAEQMRLKRSQWAEKQAGKAQTMITFPALLIMCACLLIVLAPFAMTVFENPVL